MDRRLLARAAAAALSLSLIPTAALGDPPHGKGKGRDKHADAAPVVTVPGANGPSASPAPVRVAVTFDQARGYAMDAGARGYQPLPPGIRKNLARGKPLPPGIAKQHAPASMLSRLPVHPGHEWRVCGTDLVLVTIAAGVVVDILVDVFS
jgi:hypothetical protein